MIVFFESALRTILLGFPPNFCEWYSLVKNNLDVASVVYRHIFNCKRFHRGTICFGETAISLAVFTCIKLKYIYLYLSDYLFLKI